MLTAERSPARANLHVAFTEKGEVKERREKFLTAKYGSHQMSLIRKRLAVEMWLFDELQKLYETVVSQDVFTSGNFIKDREFFSSIATSNFSYFIFFFIVYS